MCCRSIVWSTKAPVSANYSRPPVTILRGRLEPLTALRFFAAAMIVVHHCASLFQLDPQRRLSSAVLDHGVSFFFILSGFILTYVYADLSGAKQVREYLIARVARIWPSHIIAGILGLLLIPLMHTHDSWLLAIYNFKYVFFTSLLANLFLLQSWIPDSAFYFSVNPPSWSISVELFFYVSFIALILPSKKGGWISKLLVCLVISIIPVLSLELLKSVLGPDRIPGDVASYATFICPFTRLFEFVLGMSVAQLFLRRNLLVRQNVWPSTIQEMLIVIASMLSICYMNVLLKDFIQAIRIGPLYPWLIHVGSAPVFALLIFVMAKNEGFISRALSHPIFVWLGQISYSIYLLHLPILYYFKAHAADFVHCNRWMFFSLYCILVVLAAHLNHQFIEDPFRKLIRSLGAAKGNLAVAFRAANIPTWPRASTVISAFIATLLLLSLGVYVEVSEARFHMQKVEMPANVRFGDRFEVEQIDYGRADGEVKLRLRWRSLGHQQLKYNIGLQFLNNAGQIVEQHFAVQDYLERSVCDGQEWTDSVYKGSFPGACNVSKLNLVVFHSEPVELLPVTIGKQNSATNGILLGTPFVATKK